MTFREAKAETADANDDEEARGYFATGPLAFEGSEIPEIRLSTSKGEKNGLLVYKVIAIISLT